MKRDQKFFDMYSLVIGALAIFALGILVLAMKMSDLTQGVFNASTEEYISKNFWSRLQAMT